MYILNDYSIDKQFNDIEEFLDSLIDYTIPLFKIMDKYNVDLLKSYEMFNLKIIRDKSIFDVLNLKGYPEITKLKSLLNKRLYDNPYWESDNINHNCFAEAIKRKTGLISIEHERYLEDNIECKIKDSLELIPNCYNNLQLIESLRTKDIITAGEYLEIKHINIQSFCNLEGKDYFEEFITDNDIKQDEVNKIVKELNDFMNKYLNNQPLGRLSDNIESNLYEFRTTLSDSKEFRILYFLNESRFVFLNCFIKKQQKTPENQKNRTKIERYNINEWYIKRYYGVNGEC